MLFVDVTQNGRVSIDSSITMDDFEECFSRLSDKPRPLNMNTDRQRSCDEKSLSELTMGLSPPPFFRNVDNPPRFMDHPDTGVHTPISPTGLETHPMVMEALDALRRSLVFFRGRPVGTIAAVDSSDENLNYDQVNPQLPWHNMLRKSLFCFSCHIMNWLFQVTTSSVF